MNNCIGEARLSICCEMKMHPAAECFVRVCRAQGGQVFSCCAKSGERVLCTVPSGRYKVQVTGCAGANPRRITTWVDVRENETQRLNFLFAYPWCAPCAVPVCFTIADANYPEITEINGGVTIWLQQTIL